MIPTKAPKVNKGNNIPPGVSDAKLAIERINLLISNISANLKATPFNKISFISISPPPKTCGRTIPKNKANINGIIILYLNLIFIHLYSFIVLSNVLLYGKDVDNLVVLMHEKEQTVDALDGIIKILKERGYSILPITQDKEAMNFWNKNL